MEALVTISGNVGGNVEFRAARNSSAVATFRLGCTPRINRQGNWRDASTIWMTIVCYRTLAEHVLASVNKGDAVVVQGKLRSQEWSDANGENHQRLAIEATSVGHDLTRGTSAFQRMQRVDPPDDLDRETGEMIAKVEHDDVDEPIEDEPALAGANR